MFINVHLNEKIHNGFTRLAAVDIVECFRFLINSMVPQRDLSKEEWKAITTAVVDEMYFPTPEEDLLKMQEDFEKDLMARKSSNYGKSDEEEPGDDSGSESEDTEDTPKYTTLMEAIAGASEPTGEGDGVIEEEDDNTNSNTNTNTDTNTDTNQNETNSTNP